MNNWKLIIILLVLANIAVAIAVATFPKNDKVKIIACDVGQGDAILIIHRTVQILIDGGPGGDVGNCLGRYMPFWDREIELVVLTHPQDDHYGGLIDVFENYKVDYFLENEIDSSNEGYRVLETLVGGEGVRRLMPKDDLGIRYGLISLDVVYPVEFISKDGVDNVNNLSVVLSLKYGEFDALFTGDIEDEIIGQVLAQSEVGDLEYLKVPHHGSRNGLNEELLRITTPEIAVISAGKDNRYGHPHKEVLDLLEKYKAGVYRTDVLGDVVVVTDGKNWWMEN